MVDSPKSFRHLVLFAIVSALAAGVAAGVRWRAPAAPGPGGGAESTARPVGLQLLPPDLFEGGVAWLNTGGPIRLRDLKGKIVLLDFWTYCCINCHHVLPDLARLEEKYRNELVVIGVHTPKFIAERDVENVRRKVREYGIKHPVVCDSDQVIWTRLGINSWPTLVLIGPDGRVIGAASGEGNYDVLDQAIGKLVEQHKGKDLDTTPVKFFPENEKPDNTPLLFPGKVLADAAGKRLFVSDTGHNRIVMTDMDGKNPVVIGSGTAALADGSFSRAAFNRPQGMVLVGDTLYVADTENHAIRAVDLKAKTVETVAGTGEQSHEISRPGNTSPGTKTALNSPWDLAHVENSRTLYVAMAGPHQIWRLDLETNQVGPWAGTGRENILDGPVATANFAQPSGLATDGKHLYVADSEVSALRMIDLGVGRHAVHSIVGEGLFEFGDIDGRGAAVRLQHCLGVAFADGKLYVADTYNNKVKVCDPKTRAVRTLAGNGKPGESDAPAEFYQPGGVSVAGGTLYVADTNNHRVRVVNLEDRSVKTIALDGLSPPPYRPRKPVFPNAVVIKAKPAEVEPGKVLSLQVTLPVESGYKMNAEGSMAVLVETPGHKDVIAPEARNGQMVEPPSQTFTLEVPLARPLKDGQELDVRVSAQALVCSEGSKLCMLKSFVWEVPVKVVENGKPALELAGK